MEFKNRTYINFCSKDFGGPLKTLAFNAENVDISMCSVAMTLHLFMFVCLFVFF